jgi:phosphatidylglycerophosphate synthase
MSDTHYEYKWQDHSILLRLLRDPFLMPLVRMLPTSITPNQVTVFGQVVIWASLVVAVTSGPTRAALLIVALAYLLYCVADCIDGEFARYTRRTSRLGELLDHGLDAISLPLAALGFGIVMQQPAWVTLSSTAAVSFMNFATFVHGYRVGYVHLGVVGLIEGLVAGAIVAAAAAVIGVEPLARPFAGDLSIAGLLLLGMVGGSLTALAQMPGLARTPNDFTALVLMLSAVAAWFLFGQLSPLVAGLLFMSASAYLVCRLTCARLLRQPVPMGDGIFVTLYVLAASASIALGLPPRQQVAAAAVVFAYALIRGGTVFMGAVAALTP